MKPESPEKFDPFNDRRARDIRNQLSGLFLRCLPAGDMAPLEEWCRNLGAEGVYRRYLSDRLGRYSILFEELERQAVGEDFLEIFRRMWNKRLFFESHEYLEHHWQQAKGPLRRALQGLIQAAGYYIHLERGAPAAAARIGRKALAHLKENSEVLPAWLDIGPLVDAIDRAASEPPIIERNGERNG